MTDIVEVSTVSLIHEQVESVVLVEHQVTQVVTELVKELDVLTVNSVDVLEVTTPEIIVITQGQQGPPGIPGPAGGQVLQRMAGIAISALVAVFEDLSGAVWPADPNVESDVLALLGVTVSAASAGQPINVQRMGHIDDSSWQWLPKGRIFLDQEGRLTQRVPESGYDVLIGVALSATRILLNIQDPIELE